VSHSEVADGADPRQPTGDEAVDDVLGRLDTVTHEPLDVQIEVSEQVHRVLQDRLADLAQE
jgi:cell division septation protein DedD